MSFNINYFKIPTKFKALLGVKERNKKEEQKIIIEFFYVSDTT